MNKAPDFRIFLLQRRLCNLRVYAINLRPRLRGTPRAVRCNPHVGLRSRGPVSHASSNLQLSILSAVAHNGNAILSRVEKDGKEGWFMRWHSRFFCRRTPSALGTRRGNAAPPAEMRAESPDEYGNERRLATRKNHQRIPAETEFMIAKAIFSSSEFFFELFCVKLKNSLNIKIN